MSSDVRYDVFQHYGTHANRLLFTPSPAAGTTPIYIWYETDTGNVFLYDTSWHQVGSTSDVIGPGSSTNKAIARWNGTTGLLLENSTPIVQDDGRISTVTDPTGAQDAATKNYVDSKFPVSNANLNTSVIRKTIGITIDGGGTTPGAAVYGYRSFPIAGTIVEVRLFADVSGSAVMDIWKKAYASFPPLVADTITAADKPTLSSAQKYKDSTLTGWTTSVSAGDVFAFHLDSATTITRLNLELDIQLT